MNRCKCNSGAELIIFHINVCRKTDLQSTHRRLCVLEVIWTHSLSFLLALQTLKLKPEFLSSFFVLLLFNYDLWECERCEISHNGVTRICLSEGIFRHLDCSPLHVQWDSSWAVSLSLLLLSDIWSTAHSEPEVNMTFSTCVEVSSFINLVL